MRRIGALSWTGHIKPAPTELLLGRCSKGALGRRHRGTGVRPTRPENSYNFVDIVVGQHSATNSMKIAYCMW